MLLAFLPSDYGFCVICVVRASSFALGFPFWFMPSMSFLLCCHSSLASLGQACYSVISGFPDAFLLTCCFFFSVDSIAKRPQAFSFTKKVESWFILMQVQVALSNYKHVLFVFSSAYSPYGVVIQGESRARLSCPISPTGSFLLTLEIMWLPQAFSDCDKARFLVLLLFGRFCLFVFESGSLCHGEPWIHFLF